MRSPATIDFNRDVPQGADIVSRGVDENTAVDETLFFIE